MGKGVGAGLIATAVRAVIRSVRSDSDPAAAICRAVDGLSTGPDHSNDSGGFTTLFHARATGEVVRWVDAGHGLTVIARRDGTTERLASSDLPIGVGIDESWTTHETRLDVGDVLVSFSDEVLDLFGGELDTVFHVAAIAREHPRPAAVVATLIAFARSVDHDDDVTVIALARETGESEHPSLLLGDGGRFLRNVHGSALTPRTVQGKLSVPVRNAPPPWGGGGGAPRVAVPRSVWVAALER
jgi:serine phosphatase RsbU (regulator of sigma subunit)